MLHLPYGKAPEEGEPPGDSDKFLHENALPKNALPKNALDNEDKALPNPLLPPQKKKDQKKKHVTYAGLFSGETRPDEDTLEYQEWEDYQSGLGLYRGGDEQFKPSLIGLFEANASVDLVIGTGKLVRDPDKFDVHGLTKPYLVIPSQKYDLTEDIEIKDWARLIVMGNTKYRWQIEVTVNNSEEYQYTIAHTLNHEMSLHADTFLEMFDTISRLLPGPTASQEEKEEGVSRIEDFAFSQLTGNGPCAAEVMHKLFAGKLDKKWRIVITHNAMKAQLNKNRNANGVTQLEKDFQKDRTDIATKLNLPKPE